MKNSFTSIISTLSQNANSSFTAVNSKFSFFSGHEITCKSLFFIKNYAAKLLLFIFFSSLYMYGNAQGIDTLNNLSLDSIPEFVHDVDTFTIATDSTFEMEIQKIHSPAKASIMSAIFPGLGQIYNKKYWKLPIIYGGIGYATVMAIQNRSDFVFIRDQYVILFKENDNDTRLTSLQTSYEESRKTSERFYIIAGLLYVLNIVDASVDAHLFHFDVSNDLSFEFSPENRTENSTQAWNQFQPNQFTLAKINWTF